jgi:Reverse transcriptase (RNA-dependent DNA polymerase)
MFTKEGELLSASGFLRLKATAYFELDWWPAIIAKFQGLIFALFISDVSFCIIFIAKIMWRLQASIIDVETTFVHGKLCEEIYMNAPNGIDIKSNKCLRLTKTVYVHPIQNCTPACKQRMLNTVYRNS